MTRPSSTGSYDAIASIERKVYLFLHSTVHLVAAGTGCFFTAGEQEVRSVAAWLHHRMYFYTFSVRLDVETDMRMLTEPAAALDGCPRAATQQRSNSGQPIYVHDSFAT